ncbi:hypothetical protein TNCV_3030431 [Trichonephila clavipes]|nr:hypothetical protein TNCV_3030431 [Trichonephila clavipes]
MTLNMFSAFVGKKFPTRRLKGRINVDDQSSPSDSTGLGSCVDVMSNDGTEWPHLRQWVDRNTLKTLEVARNLEKSAHSCRNTRRDYKKKPG